MTALDHHKELIETARLHRIFEENEDNDRAAKAKLFGKKILKNQFIIGFAGHFSSGKSSMINALTGETLLPSSPIPTSANIVNVHKAKLDFAIVNKTEGKPVYFPENYDFEAVKQYCKSGDVTQIDIGHKDSVLPDGVSVMDTPGVDSTDDAHRTSTESALHIADMVFYVMDYNHVQSELNFNFTKELQKYTELYLIVNQIDKHQNSELDFPDFKKSVKDSFASWGVEPKDIFFTSLRDFEMVGNDFERVKSLVSSSMEGWEGNIGKTSESALNQLKDEHLNYLEDDKMERLETFSYVLSSEEWELREDVKKETTKVERRIAVQDFESWKSDFEKNRKKLVENANIMPYELRNALTLYLEAMQPDFKVGMLFSGKKTEAERDVRRNDVEEKLASVIPSQITIHLKRLMKKALKDAALLADSDSLAIEDLELKVPFSIVEAELPKGVLITGDTVLNFANSLSVAIQRWFIKETEHWKNAQKDKFESISDDAGTEIGMKAEMLNQKLFAISTLEEMDEKIEKVKRAFSAMLPNQKRSAEELVDNWQNEFDSSTDEMIEFDASMLSDKEKTPLDEEQQTDQLDEAERRDEVLVLDRARKTASAISPIRGFEETAEYLKRKASRLEGQEFTIALFGAFSAGKSSFSNALMGESVLPVSPNPTTATINRIRPVSAKHPHETADVRLKTIKQMTEDVHNSFGFFDVKIQSLEDAYRKAESLPVAGGTDQQIHKSFIDAFKLGYLDFKDQLGKTIRTDRIEFGLYVAKEERSCFVDEIDFYYDCELTRSGVTLVDTPGADSINARHTNVAFEYIRNADAILFITYYNHAFARADREFLIQLGRVKDAFEMDKMFFVVNAIDLAQNNEEQESVEIYVKEELQRFGIRFPRLFGVSSLQALKNRQQSGMPKFEEAFNHFLRDELKGLAVQSLDEAEQKAVTRFRSLIEQTDANMSRKDERLQELKILEQQLRKKFAESPAPVMIKDTMQELNELLYYVNQRVFYRFNDFFKEAFNPSLFAGTSSQQALTIALHEIVEMTAFDFEQEIRVTNFRLAQQIEKSIENRFRDETDKLKAQNAGFSFTPFEVEEAALLEPGKAFVGTDYASVKSYYKNNKSFFEKNEKEKLRDALQASMETDALVYLDKEKSKLTAWAEFWIEQEAEGLRLHIIRQGIDQIDSEQTVLQQEEKLAQWKKIYASMKSERV